MHRHVALVRRFLALGLFVTWMSAFGAPPQDPDEVYDGGEFLDALPEQFVYLYAPDKEPGLSAASEAVGTRFWLGRPKLRVCFFSADSVLVKLIATTAGEWQEALGDKVTLDFGTISSPRSCLNANDGFFQIRVGFGDRGNYSLIGKDSEELAAPLQPSMNLSGFNKLYSRHRPGLTTDNVVEMATPEHKGIIRHEFGHALGLLHEHQNPNFDCRKAIVWDGENGLIRHVGRKSGWDEDRIRRNFEFLTNAVSTIGDKTSIMVYGFDPEYIKPEYRADCVFPQTVEISSADKRFVGAQYNGGASVFDPILQGGQSTRMSFQTGRIDDTMKRIIADLSSSDDGARAHASHRLAGVFEKLNSSQRQDVLARFERGSLPFKFAVIGALANAPNVDLSQEHQALIARVTSKTNNALLSYRVASLPQRSVIDPGTVITSDKFIEFFLPQQDTNGNMTNKAWAMDGLSPLDPRKWKSPSEAEPILN